MGNCLPRSWRISISHHLLVEGPPPTVSPWAPVRDESTCPQGVGLAVDEAMLRKVLDAFAQPEPKIKLTDHSSPFRVPPTIYQHFSRAPPLDLHMAAMHRHHSSVSTATAVEHQQVIERLFEALMAAWRLKWHTTILTRFILQNQTNSVCQDAVEALFEALADQRGTVLDGSSSAVGLLR